MFPKNKAQDSREKELCEKMMSQNHFLFKFNQRFCRRKIIV